MTKEAATVGALAHCREFLSDWSRVNPIVNLMEDAVLEEVRKAGDGQMETWLPEVFAVNTSWLRDRLEASAARARKALGEAGYDTGPLI